MSTTTKPRNKRIKKGKAKSKVSTDVKKNAVLLKLLANGKKSTRKDILNVSGPSLTRAICECTKNVLSGRVYCTPSQIRKMRRHVKILRTITEKEVPIVKRKELIKQKGGFLPAVLAPLITIIGSLAAALS
jgi:hypothetical protein